MNNKSLIFSIIFYIICGTHHAQKNDQLVHNTQKIFENQESLEKKITLEIESLKQLQAQNKGSLIHQGLEKHIEILSQDLVDLKKYADQQSVNDRAEKESLELVIAHSTLMNTAEEHLKESEEFKRGL